LRDYSPNRYPNIVQAIKGVIIDIITIAISVLLYAVGLAILYWIIKTAVRHALISH